MFQHFLPSGQRDARGHLFVDQSIDYDQLADKSDRYSGADIYLVCKEAAMIPLRAIFRQLDRHDEAEQSGIYLLLS